MGNPCKTKKQMAGWVGNKSQLSKHGTRLRLAAPGNPAPPTGDPQGGGHGSPASTPDAEPKAVGFPSGPSTTRAEKSTAQEVPRMPWNRKPGVSITRPTGSISSMEKRHAPFYSEETELPFLSPFHPVMQEDRAHLRHPNSWGLYGPGCSGTNGHEAPAPPARRRQTRGHTETNKGPGRHGAVLRVTMLGT